MPSFKTELDIANRACQHLGVPRLTNFTATKAGLEMDACYDNLRESELQRNLWTATTRRVVLRAINSSTQLWTPPTYDANTTYIYGMVVVDSNGDWWQSTDESPAGSLNNTPAVGVHWSRYYGPDTCSMFIDTTDAPPATPVLSSLNNTQFTIPAATYYVKITYNFAGGETLPSSEASISLPAQYIPEIASPAAVTGAISWNPYISTVADEEQLQLFAINIGTPYILEASTLVHLGRGVPLASIPSNQAGFMAGELTNWGGNIYLSMINNNTGVPPGSTWLNVGGTTVPLLVLYPIGSGPSVDVTTSNIYKKPQGFLRQAPSNPKGSATTWLGAPWGNVREDWVFEGPYIVSAAPGPIMLRFVADFVDVPQMPSMFCEGLAARIANETCEILTQSVEKKGIADNAYKRAMFEARTVNAIEAGPIDMDIDDYITCRA